MNKQAVLSLSGGMDSSTLLLHLIRDGYKVTALSFDYGQKHKIELDRAKELVDYINSFKEDPLINHRIIKIDGLTDLLYSSLTTKDYEIPEGHYEQENMKQTVVPNRNKIFSSIIQGVALSIANQTKQDTIIAMGIHAGDHFIYPDCRQEFRDADYQAFRIGNEDSDRVRYYTPYLYLTKYLILCDGLECCEKLGLDFNEVYKRTNTSYKPIFIETIQPSLEDLRNGDLGIWYSDYKSASSVERIEAFIRLGRPDPVQYAEDKNTLVSWEVVESHVKKVLLENAK